MRPIGKQTHRHARLFLCMAILACSCPSLLFAEDQQATERVFKPKVRQVLHQYGADLFWVGHLDPEGQFMPDPKVSPFRSTDKEWEKWKHLDIYNNDQGAKAEYVYEYRSDRLIPGGFQGPWFVPSPHERIIEMEDYVKALNSGRPMRRIYNLPGELVKKPDKDKPEK